VENLAPRALPSMGSSPRAILRQGRQLHRYSGTPGRTVWAQSRQTKRPSLYAIIGLHSMPTKQCGQRMTRMVSVRVAIVFPVPRGTDYPPRSLGLPHQSMIALLKNALHPGEPETRTTLTISHACAPSLFAWSITSCSLAAVMTLYSHC
jgi:hypothetical protein